MRRDMLAIIVFFLLLPAVFSAGSIGTGSMDPVSVELCGEYSQYVTITANSVHNKENTTLYDVRARLYIPSGLVFITPNEVNLGDLAPLSGSPVSPSWTIQCNAPSQGIYTAYVNYSSGTYRGSSIDEATTTLIVHALDNLDANITVIEGGSSPPEEDPVPVINDNTPTIMVRTNRDAICKGSLDVDESYDNMDFMFLGTLQQHNYTFIMPIADGQHTVYVRCKDSFNNIMQASSEVRFIVDTSIPAVTSISGIETTTSYTKINITVSEESVCTYKIDSGSYNSFDVSEGDSFEQLITDLVEGEYDLTIRCIDIANNIGTSYYELAVSLPPSVQISIDRGDVLTVGTYQVTVIPSKALKSTPALSYTFTDTLTFNRPISLVKTDTGYRGYMIIDAFESTKIGSFIYQGYDVSGQKGTEITEGAVFLVDTNKPEKPASIQTVESEPETIKLKWFYDGEKEENFNVYRSTHSGVDYIHYYATTEGTEFKDRVDPGIKYYYRVAAVDRAGNIGALSDEVSREALEDDDNEPAETPSTPVTVVLPTTKTMLRYNNTIRDIETLYIDLDWAMTSLQEDSTKDTAVTELNIIKQAQDQKSELDKLYNQLVNANKLQLSDTELTNILGKTDSLISSIEKTTPSHVDVTKKTSYIQAESNVDLAVDEFMSLANFTDNQKNDYKKQNRKIQGDVKVEGEIKTLTITYLDGSEKNLILVTKKISYESPETLRNVNIIEMIPKTVAGDVSDIDFRTPGYFVVREDPVVSWHFDELTYDKKTLQYVIYSNDKNEAAKDTNTVVLLDPQTTIKEETNIITGFAVLISSLRPANLVQTLGVIIGLAMIVALLLYYLVYIKEVELPVVSRKTNDVVTTSPDQYFYLKNGDVIRGLSEFRHVLMRTDDITFAHHVNTDRNDFAAWVREVFHEDKLAARIQGARTRYDMIDLLK